MARMMRAGDMIDGYQAQFRADLGYTRNARRQRRIGGRQVTGSWSDPWWAYHPEHGWAIAKRWRNKAQPGYERDGREWRIVTVPAADEIVLAEPGELALAA